MSRQDQYSVGVIIDGENFGTWDKVGGGEVDSEEVKYRPGGLQPQVSLGGSRMVNNITVSRLYDLSRDHPKTPALLAKVGKATVVISKQPLDVDGNSFGQPTVYTGKLKQVTLPEADSESSAAALIELEISAAGTVG